jgi:hypothetical protein
VHSQPRPIRSRQERRGKRHSFRGSRYHRKSPPGPGEAEGALLKTVPTRPQTQAAVLDIIVSSHQEVVLPGEFSGRWSVDPSGCRTRLWPAVCDPVSRRTGTPGRGLTRLSSQRTSPTHPQAVNVPRRRLHRDLQVPGDAAAVRIKPILQPPKNLFHPHKRPPRYPLPSARFPPRPLSAAGQTGSVGRGLG